MRRLLAPIVVVLALAGCTSSGSDAPSPSGGTRTIVSTETLTRSPDAPFTPPAPAYVKTYGDSTPKGEVRKSCPYIRAGLDIETGPPNTTFADLEGNRVGVVTVLTGYTPVGCRFYFANDSPRHAVGDIRPYTFASATAARNAMVLIARVDPQAQGYPNFAPGVAGISFRTKFFREDGAKDWAFVFAKGTHMVLIHTDQDTTSENARNIGTAILGKF